MLGKAVIVSFEDSVIKVVYASAKGGNVAVTDTLILNDEQFDNFLLREKTNQFIVTHSFKDFFQEVFFIPPVKDKYVESLIEAEIKRKAPFSTFSFIHTDLGEKVVDGKKMREVFVFAAQDSGGIHIECLGFAVCFQTNDADAVGRGNRCKPPCL